jgi:hypothetical protein
LYKNATTTITSSAANISNVVFVCDTYKAGGKSFLGDGFDASMEGLTVSDDKINVTWTGDKNSVEFKTPGHQVRVKKITVTLKSEPAGIKEVNNGTVNENAPIYNLAGQCVGKDYKGVVIQNGKKFIKK